MIPLAIIIVNYRTPNLVIDCLHSLQPEVSRQRDCRVVVVDNCSGDNSPERIGAVVRAEGWDNWVTLMPLAENRGFAAGNNAALRHVLSGSGTSKYIWLVNPDTVVRPGSLQSLVDFLEEHSTVGIAGSRLEDPDGTGQRSAFRFPGIASELERGMQLGVISKLLSRHVVAPPVRTRPHVCDWVAGASMLIRREVFEAIGLFDENYFLYYEETDFCLRARRAGWSCWYVPQSRVVHLVGQSSGMKDNRSARRIPVYWLESRGRYFSKSHGRFYRLAADLAWTTGFACWRLRRWLQGKPDTDPPCLGQDFISFNFLRRTKPC